MATLRVHIWSDVACPWCYVGKRRFEAAVRRAPELEVEVVWRSFELDPGAPRVQPAGSGYAARLARKYGIPESEAQDRVDQMIAIGTNEGLTLRFDLVRSGNTFDAHRLLHLARERGLQDPLKERLFRAYFTQGVAVGEHAALALLAVDVGLARTDVDRVLSSDAYGPEVRSDEAEAQRLGIRGVPFFVLQERYGVSGAQPPDVLLAAIRQAGAEDGADAAGPAPRGD